MTSPSGDGHTRHLLKSMSVQSHCFVERESDYGYVNFSSHLAIYHSRKYGSVLIPLILTSESPWIEAGLCVYPSGGHSLRSRNSGLLASSVPKETAFVPREIPVSPSISSAIGITTRE